jgi:fermentation-respiration switch protein FrsA (DUF1100 family)
VFLRAPDGNKIHARWFRNPKGTGAVIYCPGNAGNLEHRGELVTELAAHLGKSVLIFDYPGYGQSKGQPSEAGCYTAADAAYDWLIRTEGIPAPEIVIYGESLGGGVAVDLASREPHRALVLVRTFTSVPDVADAQMSVPIGWMLSNRFNSLEKIKKCERPIFIAYADKDRLIPVPQAHQLRAASHSRAELFNLSGLGHNDPPGPDFYVALRKFLEKND